jgi:hypothetical protein
MSLTEDLDAKRSEIIDLMIRTNSSPDGTSDGDTRQFIVGYVTILRAATVEDFGPRDEYLSTVIPALRQSGMPLSVIMGGMVRVATGAAAVLGVEHAKWLCEFQGDYTARILAMWEEAA